MSETKIHGNINEKALQARANFERVLGKVLSYDQLFGAQWYVSGK